MRLLRPGKRSRVPLPVGYSALRLMPALIVAFVICVEFGVCAYYYVRSDQESATVRELQREDRERHAGDEAVRKWESQPSTIGNKL